jgi:hypothetical protein
LYTDEIRELIAVYTGLDKAGLRERLLQLANNQVTPMQQRLISIG